MKLPISSEFAVIVRAFTGPSGKGMVYLSDSRLPNSMAGEMRKLIERDGKQYVRLYNELRPVHIYKEYIGQP